MLYKKTFREPVYGTKVIVYIWEEKLFNEELKRLKIDDVDLEDTAWIYIPEHDILWMEKYYIHSLIHELSHFTFYAMEDRWVKISFKNQEPFCYFIDHYTDKVYKRIKTLDFTNKKD
jgi:hypothetical protein